MTPSSSSNTSQSDIDFGRYKRAKKSPQVVQTPIPIQPEEPILINPVGTQPINIIHEVLPNLSQANKESDSETETEIWSFDRAINEILRLLPAELCPKTQQEQTPTKPLFGIEHLMESRTNPLLVLPQSNWLRIPLNTFRTDLIQRNVIRTGYSRKTWFRLLPL